MGFLDIAVLVVYTLGVTGFGIYCYRFSKTPDGFTAANRNLPGWLVGLSIFGTYISSISFLALPGKAFGANWNPFVFSLSLPIAAYAATKWFAPLYRATTDVSAYAYLERRFGLWARLYAMTCYLLTQVARVGTILFLVALAMEPLTGLDVTTIIILAGVIIIVYTMVGGIEAVIWTDAVQSVILTIGAIVCALLLLFGMPDGPSQLFSTAMAEDKFSLGSFAFDFTSATFWMVFIYGVVINLQNFGIDQSYVQRYQTARSLTDAKKSIWIGALVYIPVSALFLFIGSALFSYYTAQPHLLPIGGLLDDKIFPHFIVTELPPGVTGLLIAALFAAAMSSVDSSLNSSATLLMTDLYVRLINKNADDKTKMRFLRVTTVVFGIAGTGMALLMISIKSALDAWWSIAGVFSGGMIGLFLLGIISRRTESTGGAIGVSVGVIAILWATFANKVDALPANPFHPFMTTVIGTLTIFCVGILLSRGKKQREKKSPAQTAFDL